MISAHTEKVKPMAEYIKKWPVVDKLTALENELQQYKPFRPCEATMYRRICDIEIEIGKMDAEDVAPVVHGRWIIDGVYVVCSICNRLTLSPIVKQLPTFKYCPNCGAMINLEEKNGKSENDRLFQASNAE